jgi:hypothetical protein
MTDLDDAIHLHQKSVQLTPQYHSDQPQHLSNIAVALQRHLGKLGEVADLNEAIALHQESIQLTSKSAKMSESLEGQSALELEIRTRVGLGQK